MKVDSVSKLYNKNCIFIRCLSSLILGLIIFNFYMDETFLACSDYDSHYNFAISLYGLKSMSINQFMNNIDNSHILAYPGWHIVLLAIRGIMSAFLIDVSLKNASIALTNTVFFIAMFNVYLEVFNYWFKGKISLLEQYLATCGLMFLGPMYVKTINPIYYLGQLTPNTWHNPTTLAVKPFAIAAFFLYIYLLENRNNQKSMKKVWILFSVTMLVSGIIKPSFFQLFVPSLVFYNICDCIISEFKSFWFNLKTACSVIPVCLLALLQFALAFGNEGDGIGIEWLMVWGNWSDYPALSLLISIIFPLCTILLTFKYIKKNKMVYLTFVVFVSGIVQFAMLYKKVGAEAGDFMWGAHLATAVFFTVAVFLMFELRVMEGLTWRYLLMWGIFLIHVYYGIYFFFEIQRLHVYVIPLSLGGAS